MNRPIIAIKLKQKNFDGIRTMATSVYLGMESNPHFINPQPSLLALKTATDELEGAITTWGTKGQRGSHSDYVFLTSKALALHKMLGSLARWCMNAIDTNLPYEEQAAILLSSGFALRKPNSKQQTLPMVQNLRRLIATNLSDHQVKLKWLRPLGLNSGNNVKMYKIYRGKNANFSDAVYIDWSPSTVYIDKPGGGVWYYFVVACNVAGDGIPCLAVRENVAFAVSSLK